MKHKEKSDPPEKKPKAKKKTGRKLLQLAIKFAVVGLILWATLTYVFGITRMAGNSMYPALRDGDLCITYKIGKSYGGDVVAYETPDGIRLGRVVAREGDTLDGNEQGLILNGAPHREEVFYPTEILGTALDLPMTLEEGEYIILNDYRSDMADSRTYGVIRQEQLKGKMLFLFRRRGF